jgi:hypothetical protein
MARAAETPAELDQLIGAVLRRSDEALSADKVRKALPPASRPRVDAVFERLRALAAEGVVHPWPGGRSPQFAATRYDDHLRERVQRALGETDLSEAELRKALRIPLAAQPLLRRTLDDLVRERRIHLHPKVGRKQPYGQAPADPTSLLAPLVKAAIAKAVKKGYDEAAARAALARLAGGEALAADEADPAVLIHDTVLELNPRAADGALVYVPHVRVAVGGRMEKDRFDRALLALFSQGRIQLQSHPAPAQLTAEEKEAMVPDGRGSYYMAVGIR